MQKPKLFLETTRFIRKWIYWLKRKWTSRTVGNVYVGYFLYVNIKIESGKPKNPKRCQFVFCLTHFTTAANVTIAYTHTHIYRHTAAAHRTVSFTLIHGNGKFAHISNGMEARSVRCVCARVLVCISSNSFEWRMSVSSSSSSKQRRWIKKGKQSDRNGIREAKKKTRSHLSLTYNEHRIVSVVVENCTYSFHSLAPIVTVQCICSFASNVFRFFFSFFISLVAVVSLSILLYSIYFCVFNKRHNDTSTTTARTYKFV